MQRYLANTNVLETRFEAPDGAFRVLDFAPRFIQHERSFRPTKLVRIVEPLAGTPRIRVSLRSGARLVEGAAAPRAGLAPHQLSTASDPSCGSPPTRRCRTSMASRSRSPSASTSCFSWGAPVEEPLEPLCERFLRETIALLADGG